jgi:hypothetical protein
MGALLLSREMMLEGMLSEKQERRREGSCRTLYSLKLAGWRGMERGAGRGERLEERKYLHYPSTSRSRQ